jgi:hypothetical protein
MTKFAELDAHNFLLHRVSFPALPAEMIWVLYITRLRDPCGSAFQPKPNVSDAEAVPRMVPTACEAAARQLRYAYASASGKVKSLPIRARC